MATLTEIEKKQAHGRRVIAKLDEVVAEIHSEPEIWFGGFGEAFTQCLSMVQHIKARTHETLQIPPEA